MLNQMRHPSYLLNPGDMFQVDIERVMAATGQQKRPNQTQKALPAAETAESAEAEEGEAAEDAAPEAEAEAADPEAAKEKHSATLKELRERAMKVMHAKDSHFRAKQKKALRKFIQEVKTAMDRARKPGDPSLEEMNGVEAELTSLLSELTLTPAERKNEAKKKKVAEQQQQQKEGGAGAASSLGLLTDRQRAVLQWMMRREAENPHDSSKPYATPWRPREWMSPFAFIPRYLEVNQRICAAVYLRHPVARPGQSEVPTPFSPTLSQLAFNWYLKRS